LGFEVIRGRALAGRAFLRPRKERYEGSAQWLQRRLWILGSLLFSWYVSNFGKYNETYGAVAAIVVLLL
jgi:membrane protein